MTRRQEREQAFIFIFEKNFRDDSIEDIIEDAINAGVYTESEYSEECFKGVFENLADIDVLIEQNLMGWKIERISKVSLSILRLAIFEMKYMNEIPESVAINEAVEIAKKYTNADESGFINGVLGSISRNTNA